MGLVESESTPAAQHVAANREPAARNAALMPSCPCPEQWIGDGHCDFLLGCSTVACGYDNGDCADEKCLCRPEWMGDGVCDLNLMNCNSAACEFDRGDCWLQEEGIVEPVEDVASPIVFALEQVFNETDSGVEAASGALLDGEVLMVDGTSLMAKGRQDIQINKDGSVEINLRPSTPLSLGVGKVTVDFGRRCKGKRKDMVLLAPSATRQSSTPQGMNESLIFFPVPFFPFCNITISGAAMKGGHVVPRPKIGLTARLDAPTRGARHARIGKVGRRTCRKDRPLNRGVRLAPSSTYPK